jgi:prepilin-type N-terminal cleavage/methylation domain-containing protein
MTLRSALATQRPAGAPGFTLIEIIFAMAVFAVGVLALAAVIPLGVKKNSSSAQQSRASELAASRAEQLLQAPFSEPDMAVGTHDDPNNPYLGQYYVRWTVEDDQPAPRCKRIAIVVNRPTLTSPTIARLLVVSSDAGS